MNKSYMFLILLSSLNSSLMRSSDNTPGRYELRKDTHENPYSWVILDKKTNQNIHFLNAPVGSDKQDISVCIEKDKHIHFSNGKSTGVHSKPISFMPETISKSSWNFNPFSLFSKITARLFSLR